MPTGYLVTLGDAKLDANDPIGSTPTSFTTSNSLGSGSWIWSGKDRRGNTVTNGSDTGQYYLASDGNIYFVPSNGKNITVTSASANTPPNYDAAIFGTAGNDTSISGTAGSDYIYGGSSRSPHGTGNDTINAGAGNDRVFGGDGNDTINGGDGNDTLYGGRGNDIIDGGAGNDTIYGGTGADTIAGGTGADTIYGGGGNDVIDGGAGDDVIYGDYSGSLASSAGSLKWDLQGADGASLSNGFVQNTGAVDVAVSFNNDGNNNPLYQVETSDTIYAPESNIRTTSSLYLYGNGDAATSTTTISFAASEGSQYSDDVKNVKFRINDIDWGSGNHRDIVTVNAYDANGGPVSVSITPSGNDTVSGNTITAGSVGETQADAGGSALIQIAGPVSYLTISYSNGQSGTQAVWVSDIVFETVIPAGGDDILDGGSGNDTLHGGAGNDTLIGGDGADQLYGGDGRDVIFAGMGDVVDGGEGGDDLDTLNLTGQGPLRVIYDPANRENGTIQFLDAQRNVVGTTAFQNIENVVACFTPGTFIETIEGDQRVELLNVGDIVLTKDSGFRPVRWIGTRQIHAKELAAQPLLQPILIRRGALGNGNPMRDMRVSPQHRILLSGPKAELLFGEDEVLVAARHLTGLLGIEQLTCISITYLHVMFDRHEIVRSDGLWSESFQPQARSNAGLDDEQHKELLQIFPTLAATGTNRAFQSARRTLRSHEVRVLIAS